MSGKGGSLAAVGADGFAVPDAFDFRDPAHRSVDAFHGAHRLGARRTRRLGRPAAEGGPSLVVRLELPFDAVCLNCGATVAQGERANADKRRVGTYLEASGGGGGRGGGRGGGGGVGCAHAHTSRRETEKE